jgi:hypothetical protein
MGLKSRRKGAAFEQRIARDLVAAAREWGFTSKDCYRTPLSGGHPFGDRGDLCIAPSLRAAFPFTVECKNYRDWTPAVMLRSAGLRAQEREWFTQVEEAASGCGEALPLLVVQGARTGIYAALPLGCGWAGDQVYGLALRPHLRFHAGGSRAGSYILVEWAAFLDKFRERCRVKLGSGKKSTR